MDNADLLRTLQFERTRLANQISGEIMDQVAMQEARPWDRPFWEPTRGKEGVFTYIVLIHGLAIAGLILFPMPSWKVFGFTLLVTALGGLGTTVCYHRMLAHRTVKTNRFIEQLLIFCAVLNGSGHPASWVAYHRLHHSVTDAPEDISSPKQGGFWWGASSLAVSNGTCRQTALGSRTDARHLQDVGLGRIARHSSFDFLRPCPRPGLDGFLLVRCDSPVLFAAHAMLYQ